jgi:hypothetical protein
MDSEKLLSGEQPETVVNAIHLVTMREKSSLTYFICFSLIEKYKEL